MAEKYDFAGWVTKNDIRCTDGLVIRHNAFLDNDSKTVPLVWDHSGQSTPENILGHIKLENRDNGVYGYGKFNDTDRGQTCKKLVQSGDIGALSIAANRVRRANGNQVVHGNIYEVSLVMSGANPGAYIDSISHSDNGVEVLDEILFSSEHIHSLDYPDDNIEGFEHASKEKKEPAPKEEPNGQNGADIELTDEENKAIEDAVASLSQDDLKKILDFIIKNLHGGRPFNDEEDFTSFMANLSDEDSDKLANFLFSQENSEDVKHSDNYYEEDDQMAYNVFENNNNNLQNEEELIEIKHSMINDLKQGVDTLQGVVRAYEGDLIEHGVTNIDMLFAVEPDKGAPGWIKPEEPSIVETILSKIKTTPQHQIHGRWADITGEEARARGYIKGREKLDEVFPVLNRRTHPQTVYKKQSFDRDDWADVTDFDLVEWVKPEMQEMLRYELARAVLIGDGRKDSSPDKINENAIRPIVKDDKLFVTKVYGITADTFIETAMRSRRLYKGSGRPDLFCDLVLLTEIELKKDGDGRYLYGSGNAPASDSDIAKMLGVNSIICPQFMDGTGYAIEVNLSDYEFAVPDKGKAKMFDDFDIDFNKMKYLIETRLAGAMNQPKGAVVFTKEAAPTTSSSSSASTGTGK